MAVYAFNDDKLLVETYSKASIDNMLAEKVSTATYNNGVASLTTDINKKVDTTTYNAGVQTLNTAINGKANSSHTHSISNVTNLQSSLDGKASTSHTHTLASCTGNLAFSRITGLSFSLSGTTLTITKS